MAPTEALAQLALQKRLLLKESDAHRLVLASELVRITRPVHWMDRFRLQARPLILAGAPVAAYLFARRSKGMTRWVATAFGALRIYRSLASYLRRPTAAS